MQIRLVDFNPQLFCYDFIIINKNLEIPLLYHKDGKYFPLNRVFNQHIDKKKIKALVSEDLAGLINFFISLKGENNINLIEVLRILNISKSLNVNLLSSQFKKYERYLPILSYKEEVIESIEKGLLFPEVALLIEELKNYNHFLEIINTFRLTFSEQKELFNYLKNKENTIDITKNKNKEELIRLIRAELYPKYYNQLQKFNEIKKRLSLPKKVVLKETPFFETKDLKIEITFKNLKELKDRIEAINKQIEQKEELWKELIDQI